MEISHGRISPNKICLRLSLLNEVIEILMHKEADTLNLSDCEALKGSLSLVMNCLIVL